MAPRFDYDPQRSFEVRVYDVEYQPGWEARIYQPEGTGPFPALLFVHGGAWSRWDHTTQPAFNRGISASGVVVVSPDFRLAPDDPYPAQVADVNYCLRWLKAHASEFNSMPQCIGGLGSSSGGHTLMLAAMRPDDPRYTAIQTPDVVGHDARFAYTVATWSVLDSYARYQYAKLNGIGMLTARTENYFYSKDQMQEGSPQGILDRGESAELPPLLVIQGTADRNIPMSIPERFVESYRSAGGSVEFEIFPDAPHIFVHEPGEDTDRALELVKRFVARQLASVPTAVAY